MKNITLNQLMHHFFPSFKPIMEGEVVIKQLQLNSRYIQQDDLFFGVIGHHVDGRQYVTTAIKNGAIAVVLETEQADEHLQYTVLDGVPLVKVFQLKHLLSAFGDFFYDSPSHQQIMTAVTGTNGKTTISQIIAQWAALLGKKTAVLGTIGNGVLTQLEPSENTTISAIDVQRYLASFVTQKVDLTAMEISSHGLSQGRVEQVKFDVVAFTNLSHDHLDYHGTMEAYGAVKWKLFSANPTAQQVINIDDPTGKIWLQKLPRAIAVSTEQCLTSAGKHRYVYASDMVYNEAGAHFKISSSWGEALVQSHLIGPFNVNNILVALASLLSLGYNFASLIAVVSDLKPICGRMEHFIAPDYPVVIVDYAHTPDGLEKALEAARNHCVGELWCVFGSGGDRDKLKRPEIGKVAELLADHIVITDDNPRMESSSRIIEDIVKGLHRPLDATIITNRLDAIKYAIRHASPNDTILISGKGHEDYQDIGGEKIPYNERQMVASIMGLTCD